MGVEGGAREGVVQSVIDWKCKLAEGGTSTATTRQMAIGQRVRVSKFANRGNKFDFVLEIIKSSPTNFLQSSIPSMTPVDVRNSTYKHDHPPYTSSSRIIKPRNHFYPSRFLKSTICHNMLKVYTPLSPSKIRGNRRRKGEKIVLKDRLIYTYRTKYNRRTIVFA